MSDLPILLFDASVAWSAWLAANHATSQGVWLQIARKESSLASVTYAEALDAALCYGWIDGQKGKMDETWWL